MALIYRDTFTETSDTTLASHTPDTGTGWTNIISIGSALLQVNGANDWAESDGTGGLSDGCLYTADATYPSADYEVSFRIASAVEGGDDTYILAARVQDSNNFYFAEFSSNAFRIGKCVSGTFSDIVSSTNFPAGPNRPDDEDIVSFTVVGSTLTFRVRGVAVGSGTDTDITAAGKAGLGIGEIGSGENTDCDSQRMDDFRVHSIVSGASDETLRPNAAGDLNQMLHKDGSSGDSNNYTEVDESGSDDGDTTYVKTPGIGANTRADLYNIPSTGIGGSDTINSVTVTSRQARGANWATGDYIAPALKIDSTEHRGRGVEPAATTYETVEQKFYHNPTDGTVWTNTDIENLQIGAAGFSDDATGFDTGDELRCTQVYVTINYDTVGGGGAVKDLIMSGIIPFER